MSGLPSRPTASGFAGTRVPVKILFEFVDAGDSLDEFLRQYPTVKREQAVAAMESARDGNAIAE
jgi:uncharacterized protein (DUF433 family)